MDPSKSIVEVPPPPPPPSEAESQFSSLVHGISQQLQESIENMLEMANEAGQISSEIIEEIDKSKHSAIERNKILAEEKEHFLKAAYTMLNRFDERDGYKCVKSFF